MVSIDEHLEIVEDGVVDAIDAALEMAEKLVFSLKMLKHFSLKSSPRQSVSEPLKSMGVTTKSVGVYLYIHNDKVMSVGQGRIYNRVRRFNKVFLNGGVPDADSHYHTAVKCFEYDSDILNWQVEVIVVPGDDDVAKYLSAFLEIQLQERYNPPFSDIKMAGKG
jgi:hypothetical protein